MGGAMSCSEDFEVTPKTSFVAGGFHRGDALASVMLVDDEIVYGQDSALGPLFDQYLQGYDIHSLKEIIYDYHEGIDAVRDFDSDWVEIVRPVENVARQARLTRRLTIKTRSQSTLTHYLLRVKLPTCWGVVQYVVWERSHMSETMRSPLG
jgi:hypothetical protein